MGEKSHFSGLAVAQPIEVFHVNKMYLESSAPNKVNLSVGAYRTEEGKPWVLPVVRECEKRLAADDSLTHEYLPVLGYEPFTQEAVKLLLGSENGAIKSGRAFGVQSLSGTGALRVGADFLHSVVGCEIAYVSKPTWAYRTEEGKPWVLPVVRECEKRLAADDSLTHEYLPVLGYEPFTQEAVKLLLGSENGAIKSGRAFGVQSLSGTGALRVGADFLHSVVGCEIAYVSKPTWGNHKSVFTRAGFKEVREYRYWDQANRKLDFDGFCEDLNNAPPKSVVILHGCAHNPTGMDPTHEQWTKLGQIFKQKGLVAFFDIAYQGFASGSPDSDAWAVRHFVDSGHEILCAQSYAKNFGLYNERAGNLTLVVSNKDDIAAIKSQITLLIRANYSNPPAHGARVVHMALSTPELRAMWHSHIEAMSGRIKSMRAALRSRLEALKTPGTWEHVTQQIGMFSYLGINEAQSQHMVSKHNVFLLKSGRINVCGLNEKNVDHVAAAIHDAVTSVKGNL